MAEEHRLSERCGNGGRVENGESSFCACTARMHGARDLLFARSGVTLHEHAEGLRRDAIEHCEELAHGGGASEQTLESAHLSGLGRRDTHVGFEAQQRIATRTIAPGASSTSSTR